MWRNLKFLHMWSNFKCLHMTDVEKNLKSPSLSAIFAVSSRNRFVAIYALLCGENLSQKLCPWRKNDKYEVCIEGFSFAQNEFGVCFQMALGSLHSGKVEKSLLKIKSSSCCLGQSHLGPVFNISQNISLSLSLSFPTPILRYNFFLLGDLVVRIAMSLQHKKGTNDWVNCWNIPRDEMKSILFPLFF